MTWLVAHWWFWHPLDEGTGSTCSATNHTGCGYAAWSGILGSFVFSVPAWLLTAFMFFRHHNCHEPRCPWPGRVIPETGLPACRKHHPHRKETR